MIVVRNLAYWPTPKAACSSVKYALAILEGKVAPPYDRVARSVHMIFPTGSYRPGMSLENHFKFIVVRDPVERFISAWRNRIVDHRDLAVSLRKFALELTLCRSQSAMVMHHTNLQSHHIGVDLSQYDFVCPIERLDELSRKLSERTGKKVKIPHVGGSSKAHAELKPDELRAVVKFYSSDYELLKDYYRRPI